MTVPVGEISVLHDRLDAVQRVVEQLAQMTDQRITRLATEVQAAVDNLQEQLFEREYQTALLAFECGKLPTMPPMPPKRRRGPAQPVSACCGGRLVARPAVNGSEPVTLCFDCGEEATALAPGADRPEPAKVVLS